MRKILKVDNGIKVKDLKEALEGVPDDVQVYIGYEGVFGRAREVSVDTDDKGFPGVFVNED